MPVYEYECSKCGEEFESLRDFRNRDKEVCAVCFSSEVERKLSRFNLSVFPIKSVKVNGREVV